MKEPHRRSAFQLFTDMRTRITLIGYEVRMILVRCGSQHLLLIRRLVQQSTARYARWNVTPLDDNQATQSSMSVKFIFTFV